MRWLRVAVPAAVLLAALVDAPAARAALPKAAGEPWVEARSARFRVFSNGGAAVATRAAQRLERLADVLERTTGGLRTDGRREVRVFVFRERESFEPYQPFGKDASSASAGFHVASEDAGQIAAFDDHGPYLQQFLAHEYVHEVLERSLGAVPVWLNEGLAEFYSTFVAKGQEADIGLEIPEHVRWLRQQMLTSRELFAVRFDSRSYQEGDRRGTIYAQSWGLVHMLYMDRVDAERFSRLMNVVARGAASADAVQQVYGPAAPDSLAAALRQYVAQGGVYSLTWKFDTPFDAVAVRTRDVGAPEALALLGELVVGMGPAHAALAREHLEAAWAADSSASEAAGFLARVCARAGDTAAADRWEDAARRVADRAPRGAAAYGAWLSRRRLETERYYWPARGPTPLARRARELLAPMVAAKPEVLEWLVPYAFTFLDERETVSEGVGSLLLAREAWTHRTELEGALCVLQVRAGQLGAAEKLFAEISPGPDQAFWRGQAGWLIAHARLDSLPEWLRRGRFDDAESLAVQVDRRLPVASVHDLVRDVRADIATRRAQAAASAAPPAPGRAPAPGGAARTSAPGPASPAPQGTAPARESANLELARRAREAGDWSGAEAAYEAERAVVRDPAQRARLAALAAEMRHRRRLAAATALGDTGRPADACRLLDLVLADHPGPEVRREVAALQQRFCRR